MRLGILCLPACRRPGSGYHDPWRWGGVWRGCSAGGTRHPAYGCRGRCPACGQSSPPTAHHVHHPPAQLLPPQRVSLHTEIRLSTGLTVLKKPGLRIRSGEVHKIFPDPKPRSDLWQDGTNLVKPNFVQWNFLKKLDFFCLLIQKFI